MNDKKIKKEITRCFEKRKYRKAERLLLDQLKKHPEDIDLNSMLGRVYIQLNEPESALPHNQKVAEALPKNCNALFNLAISCQGAGKITQAEKLYREILAIDPKNHRAIKKLCSHYVNIGALEEAEKLLLRIIDGDEKVFASIELSRVYIAQGLFKEAEKYLRQALSLEPVNPAGYNNLALILYQSCRHEESYQAYKQAFEYADNIAGIFHNYLLGLHYDDQVTDETVFKEHIRWGNDCLEKTHRFSSYQNLPITNRRLRIGYLSRDFRHHSVGFFMQTIFEHHSDDVELFVYYNYPVIEKMTKFFQSKTPVGWKSIHSLDDDMVADVIRTDRIDILVDLSGHTHGNRLEVFAKKPAPVQVTYLGYPDTTGLSTIDYRISDDYADPIGVSEKYHAEKIVRIEDSFLCYAPPENVPDVQIIRERGDESEVVFGSFNSSAKISRKTIALWSKILLENKNSRLILKSNPFKDDYTASSVAALFYEHGVREEQLKLLGFIESTGGHLALYNDIDVALDPYPYHGTTTTFEALYMGTPVVTLVGDRHSCRVGYSILENLGLNECIAHTEDEYCLKVHALAANRDRIVELKKTLRKRLINSVLMDGKSFTAKLERGYRSMWMAWCEREGDIGYSVNTLLTGEKLVLPDSDEVLHTFVIREQGTWFEKEIQYLPRLLQNGMTVVDIGAGFGLFSIVMAKLVGDRGACLSIEPSSDLCSYLRLSIRENGLHNVKVIEGGLGAVNGGFMVPLLKTPDNKVSDYASSDAIEAEYSRILTLNEIIDQHVSEQVDFVRLDAAGNELDILQGGKEFFQSASPLVMFDAMGEKGLRVDLLAAFQTLGYSCYYLVPGIEILRPFSAEYDFDAYMLNLFACKDIIAAQLNARGVLSLNKPLASAIDFQEQHYHTFWQSKAYFATLRKVWDEQPTGDSPVNETYFDALNKYIFSMDSSLPVEVRDELLFTSHAELVTICNDAPSLPRLLTLARVSLDCGKRRYAVEILKLVYNLFNSEEQQLSLNEEHLAPCSRFDIVDPGEKIGEWCLSAVVAALIENEYFSLFFEGNGNSLEQMQLIEQFGFLPPEIRRRYELVLAKTGGN